MPLQPQHGVDYLIETLRQAGPSAVTLCPWGRSNIGMALVKAPDIPEITRSS
jgi:purine nucleosidase